MYKPLHLGSNNRPTEMPGGVALSTLAGKKMAFMGDSIVHLNTFPTIVGDITGAITANYGLFGFKWAESNPAGIYDALVMRNVADAVATNTFTTQIAAANLLYTNSGGTLDLRPQVAAMDAEDWATVDYLVIMYGTNDVGSNVPIGSPTSVVDYEFKGAINYTLATIQAARPNLQIILVTPGYLAGYETTKNTTGAYNYNYADALIERGAAYKVPVMDMLRSSGINTQNYVTFLPDGVHPNAAGNIRIADKLAGFLLTRTTDAVGPTDAHKFARAQIWRT